MKNLTNAKKLLVMILLVGVVLITTSVYAAEGDWNSPSPSSGVATTAASPSAGTDLSGTLLTTTSPSPSPSASPSANTNTNTALTLNGTTTTNTSTNTNTAVTNYSPTNTNDLPATGLADSVPLIALIVVVAISAVYAYKKVQDYQNL